MKKVFLMIILASMFLTANAQIFTTNPYNGRTPSWSGNTNSGGLFREEGGDFPGSEEGGDFPGSEEGGDFPESGYTCFTGCGILAFFGALYVGAKYHRKRKDVREDDNKGH